MNYDEIYYSAVQLLNEDQEMPDVADYERRAGYLLATFTTLATPVDITYRELNGLPALSQKSYTYVELTKFFPLSTIFAPAATYYLASMLVLDENEELSDKLFALYVNEIATIQASFPAQNLKTVDRYGLLT